MLGKIKDLLRKRNVTGIIPEVRPVGGGTVAFCFCFGACDCNCSDCHCHCCQCHCGGQCAPGAPVCG